jgi:hypothetical protein
MLDILENRLSAANRNRGVALLMVLLMVMAVCILSLGFLARCDTELACGQNMLLRTQMDQLADSALEHAKGLILQPQDVVEDYWSGAVGQQLLPGSSDYYEVSVTRDPCDPNDCRSYIVSCEAYRLRSAEKVGRSRLSAQLRLDPCIALWTGVDTVFRPGQAVCGDIYCAGRLTNSGIIDGDVFASALTGTPPAGRLKPAADLSLRWPPVADTYLNPDYSPGVIGPGEVSATTYEPARIWRCTGDLTLGGNVIVDGMLLVEGTLTIRGDGNHMMAAKNLPALYVGGDLVIGQVNGLAIDGLAVVHGSTWISAAASNVDIVGGLFMKGRLGETAPDSSGANVDAQVHDAPTWLPTGGRYQGALQFDGANDYLQTPDGPSPELSGDYTISVWVKPAAVQKAGAGIVAKTDTTGSINHWALYLDGGNLWVSHPTGAWPTGIALADLTALGTWHNVAIVRQGNTMSSYLDGALRTQDTWDVGPGSGMGHLNIAADRTAGSDYLYAGLIDDLRIYNQAADPNFVPPTGSAGLIGHWKLDESGSDVTIAAEPTRSAIAASTPDKEYSEEHWSQAADAFFQNMHRD